jgi:hypothetical protein
VLDIVFLLRGKHAVDIPSRLFRQAVPRERKPKGKPKGKPKTAA